MFPILQQTAQILKKDFNLPEIQENFTEEGLVEILTPVIKQMLDRDFERLLQICYRIDLGEQVLKKILHESDPDQMANDLSRALVKRQVQKIEIRKKYQNE
ncbi:hypothetical protein [Cecembia calidifontis]|jgi:hypothetical protein|uniref:Uncharacterized protein n=1 Tax=Cecembia calidifontis TaxID=1187080 RepID=A0A4V2F626_9BACT|nr:hypothetical protein [Cecembia calidifontis]RZS94849.1 hypothetical protein BC751_0359 [Cecembia calidifontis]